MDLKRPWKTIALGAAHTYITYMRENPLGTRSTSNLMSRNGIKCRVNMEMCGVQRALPCVVVLKWTSPSLWWSLLYSQYMHTSLWIDVAGRTKLFASVRISQATFCVHSVGYLTENSLSHHSRSNRFLFVSLLGPVRHFLHFYWESWYLSTFKTGRCRRSVVDEFPLSVKVNMRGFPQVMYFEYLISWIRRPTGTIHGN